MKVAVLGGGTAGFMAAAHLSRYFPEAELFHIYDPKIPTIGVGEGTTPGFRMWLDEVAPVDFSILQQECHTTKKFGVQFENWGRGKDVFSHDFVPQESNGLHISAARVVTFLQKYVRAKPVLGHVSTLLVKEDGVDIEIDGRPLLSVDLIVDARGFPKQLGKEHIQLTWIPTDSALVTRCPAPSDLQHTRAVARPHGWIFVIPLTESTAYGYIYGDEYSSKQEVEDDFSAFLSSERVVQFAEPKQIRFPNFVCKEACDGRVFKIGNAASFIEPLEASSLAVVRIQLELFGLWLQQFRFSSGTAMTKQMVETVNGEIRNLILELSVFIGWHYANGSKFDTAFWRGAQLGFHHAFSELVPPHISARLQEHLDRAVQIPVDQIRSLRTHADLDRFIDRLETFPRAFGGITPIGFAQLSDGLIKKSEITSEVYQRRGNRRD